MLPNPYAQHSTKNATYLLTLNGLPSKLLWPRLALLAVEGNLKKRDRRDLCLSLAAVPDAASCNAVFSNNLHMSGGCA